MLHTQATQPAIIVFPLSGIIVMERRYSASFQMPTAIDRSHLELVYVLDGEGTMEFSTTAFRFRAGDAFLVPPHSMDILRVDPDRVPTLLILFIEFRHFAHLAPETPIWHTPRLFSRSRIGTEFQHAMQQILFEQTMQRAGHAAAVTALALGLLVTLYRWQIGTQPKVAGPALPETLPVARVQAYVKDIEQRFFETERMADVAKRLGLSQRRFAQIFVQITGSAWLPYLQKLRIHHAKRLLAQNAQRSTVSIVFECGFGDLSTFYRIFKKHTGSSPHAWRAKGCEARAI